MTDQTQRTLPDNSEMNHEDHAATLRWWSDHRLRYNAGLVVACAMGIILWVAAVSRCIDLKVPGDWEVSGFTLVGQAVISAVIIALANVLYWLGPWCERLFRPRNAARYRKLAFRLGFWLSVVLPLMPAANLFNLSSHYAN